MNERNLNALLFHPIVKTVKNSPDSSGMAFGFCGLNRFCSLCGCYLDSIRSPVKSHMNG